MKSKKLTNFYKKQNTLVEAFFILDRLHGPEEELDAELSSKDDADRKVKIAIYGSFAVNILLFIVKIYASIATQSIAVIASALVIFFSDCSAILLVLKDSLLDLLSGSIIFVTNYLMNRRNQ